MTLIRRDWILLSVVALSFTTFLATIWVLTRDKNQPTMEIMLSQPGCEAAKALGAELRIDEFCLGYATEMTRHDFKLQNEIRVSRELVLGWRPTKSGG